MFLEKYTAMLVPGRASYIETMSSGFELWKWEFCTYTHVGSPLPSSCRGFGVSVVCYGIPGSSVALLWSADGGTALGSSFLGPHTYYNRNTF